MFRKVLIFAMFATAAGYCFADAMLPQFVTSEVFYDRQKNVQEDEYNISDDYMYVEPYEPVVAPVWPVAGSDADVTVECDEMNSQVNPVKKDDNIRIVSKIGDDIVVDNSFNFDGSYGGWSGGANMLHGNQVPMGFIDDCDSKAEMPLLNREIMEDDGGNVLSISRSGRKTCDRYADGYSNYIAKQGSCKDGVCGGYGNFERDFGEMQMSGFQGSEISLNIDDDAPMQMEQKDVVTSWVVASGQTLREVLQSWCDKEGWDLVWTTSREYPIEASAIFKGRFVDVASALVRNFGRATPIPYAKFYKGNRVLVISTDAD